MRIYDNKIENRATFVIKAGYHLQLLTLEMMKLIGSAKSKINKDENSENIPCLETIELGLVHCNIVNKDYQQDSKVSYLSVPNKFFDQLLDISLKDFIFSNTINFEVWFSNQNSNLPKIKDKINISLVVN